MIILKDDTTLSFVYLTLRNATFLPAALGHIQEAPNNSLPSAQSNSGRKAAAFRSYSQAQNQHTHACTCTHTHTHAGMHKHHQVCIRYACMLSIQNTVSLHTLSHAWVHIRTLVFPVSPSNPHLSGAVMASLIEVLWVVLEALDQP